MASDNLGSIQSTVGIHVVVAGTRWKIYPQIRNGLQRGMGMNTADFPPHFQAGRVGVACVGRTWYERVYLCFVQYCVVDARSAYPWP